MGAYYLESRTFHMWPTKATRAEGPMNLSSHLVDRIYSVIFSELIANRKCIPTALPAGSAFHYPCLTCGRSVSRNLYNLRDAMRSILSCSPSFPAFRIVNSRTTRLIQSSSLGVRSPLRFETPNDGAYALFVDLLDDGNTSGEGVRIYSLLEIRPSGIEGRASRWIDLGLSIKRSGLELVSLSRRLKRFYHRALAAIPFSKTPAALPRSTGQLS